MLPVRCYTCNKIIGNKEKQYEELVKEGFEMRVILDELGLKRYCCRRMLMGCI